MIWLNPLAWLGVVGVALPVLIHLLGRGHARVHRFPTLRFLRASRLLPTRRTRIHDLPLLLVRCGIIGLAAAALARPVMLTSKRRRSLDRGLARAIVVDTSASMRRTTPSGARALDSAGREARALAAAAQTSVIVESNDPARAVRGASNWLVAQGRRAELVVISDFQRGQIDSTDFAIVPRAIGLTMRRVPTVVADTIESTGSLGAVRVSARGSLAGDRVDATWRAAATTAARDAVSLLGADADGAALAAIRTAVAAAATPLPVDTSRSVAVVFPGFAGAGALHAALRPDYAPWMVELLARVNADSLNVVASGVAPVAGRTTLVVFTSAEPGSLAGVRLAAAAHQSLSVAPSPRELEPGPLSDATIAAFQRPALDDAPSQSRPTSDAGPSDGRWLWLGAFALMLIELRWRRAKAAGPAASSTERARAA